MFARLGLAFARLGSLLSGAPSAPGGGAPVMRFNDAANSQLIAVLAEEF